MNRSVRTLWSLAAIGGATVVGITTRDAGLTAITFFGGLWVPRLLGLSGRHHWHNGREGWGGPQGRGHRLEQRLDAWHRQAHEHVPSQDARAADPVHL